jgi:hypothetical protein
LPALDELPPTEGSSLLLCAKVFVAPRENPSTKIKKMLRKEVLSISSPQE